VENWGDLLVWVGIGGKSRAMIRIFSHVLIFPMALGTLKHRDISEIERVLEWPVGLMTTLALPVCQRTQIDRVFERAGGDRLFRGRGVVNDGVTNIAVITDHLSSVAYVLSIMTTEAAREIEMTDIVRVRLPVGFHLRKEIGAEYSLYLRDRSL
jgi:hypothetical protein